MQNNIYEVSSSPIPAEQRAKAGNMPDWFFERICDYAENATSEERESAIQTLSRILGSPLHKRGKPADSIPGGSNSSSFKKRSLLLRGCPSVSADRLYSLCRHPTGPGLSTRPSPASTKAMRTSGIFTSIPG